MSRLISCLKDADPESMRYHTKLQSVLRRVMELERCLGGEKSLSQADSVWSGSLCCRGTWGVGLRVSIHDGLPCFYYHDNSIRLQVLCITYLRVSAVFSTPMPLEIEQSVSFYCRVIRTMARCRVLRIVPLTHTRVDQP